MKLNHPFYYFLLAVISAVGAAVISSTKDDKRRSRWRLLGTITLPFLVIFSAWAFWQAQERVSQRWNSQIIFEASVDKDANLVMRNTGQVGIEDIRLYATIYRLNAVLDKSNHLHIRGLDNYSKVSGPLKTIASLEAGHTATLDLSAFANLLPFYDFDEVIREGDPLHKAMTEAYCLRITLRNTITKRRHSYYVVTAPWRGTTLPSVIDQREDAASTGPVDMKWFNLRAKVRKHQAELFDEVDDYLFRNREVR